VNKRKWPCNVGRQKFIATPTTVAKCTHLLAVIKTASLNEGILLANSYSGY